MTIAEMKERGRLSQIHQIYYNDQTKVQCWDQFQHLHNPTCNEFMENQVIYDFLDTRNDIPSSAWFGILSPKFGFKAVGQLNRPPNATRLDQKLKECEEKGVMVLGFQRHSRTRNPIFQGNNWHLRGKEDNFSDVFEKVIQKAGITYDIKTKTRKNREGHYSVIMMNYIIAPYWIWKMYFNEILKPCMDVMKSDEELKQLLWQDSGYKKNQKLSPAMQAAGMEYYPLHTFICERFWTMFLHIHREFEFLHF